MPTFSTKYQLLKPRVDEKLAQLLVLSDSESFFTALNKKKLLVLNSACYTFTTHRLTTGRVTSCAVQREATVYLHFSGYGLAAGQNATLVNVHSVDVTFPVTTCRYKAPIQTKKPPLTVSTALKLQK